MKRFAALLKREVMEHRGGFVFLPAILMAVMLLLTVVSLFFSDMAIMVDDMDLAGRLSAEQEANPEKVESAALVAYYGLSAPVWLVLPFVIMFTLLGALYEERRDRSILFWKSMPVSDWEEVAAKLVAAAVVAPLIALVVVMAGQVAAGVVLTLGFLVKGGPIGVLWPVLSLVGSWFLSLPVLLYMVLWALPVMAWFLAMSAFANRSPLFFAVIPPLVLGILERIIFDSAVIGRFFSLHLGGWVDRIALRVDVESPLDLLRIRDVMVGAMGEATFLNPQFYVGLVVAAGLLAISVELRRRAA
ncbi:hypothetical protein [Yunchengibacter salinarum]|uniref:hypothetical protein n=1 Tax=Yunchengibacter salinarum TaxID=3133399 RepID=UPI0035B5A2CF